ncbi:hypothetical protein [Yersinia aldovae]|uniref:Uncharacterized protein n=1 Tax=Yersinia aldovae TaxID=29483 RepID=A0ABM9SU13_YERAL|nr:hypothetical protein [Yersinia aldovae]CNH23265.1 Uncharacterised protein [Yersinia aldovae]CNL15843.1 Uncharacterised protein [Yersinia aldovae]
MTNKRWMLILAYLLVFCSVALIATGIIGSVFIKWLGVVFYGLPFGIDRELLWRCVKGGFIGGIIIGFGSWIWYRRNYNLYK